VLTGCADGEVIAERSGTRMRRYGGGKEIVGRSDNRIRRWRRDSREKWHKDSQMWRRKRVERSGTRMRRHGGGKDCRKEWQQDAQKEKG
jgi:hypothetical protein